MSKSRVVEYAIFAALTRLGRATARQVELDVDVATACRLAKIKARHRLEMLVKQGRVVSSQEQMSVYWVLTPRNIELK